MINMNVVVSIPTEGAECGDTSSVSETPLQTAELLARSDYRNGANNTSSASDVETKTNDRSIKRRIYEDASFPIHSSSHRSSLRGPCERRSRKSDVNPTPKLPIEVCEAIIDRINEIFDDDRSRDLASCARVCRAWVPRAQMHLFSMVNVWPSNACFSVRQAVRRKPFLLQCITSFEANYDKTPQLTTLLIAYQMRFLKQCSIHGLDLKTVHPSLSRFPSSATSLQMLELRLCQTGDANQLCRFLTSFRSLSILILSWESNMILHGYDLPHLQFNRSMSFLQILAIKLRPGISGLLKAFIKARPFVTRLKHIIFSWRYIHPELPSPAPEITELLLHCSQSLEEVTMVPEFFVLSFSEDQTSADPPNHRSIFLNANVSELKGNHFLDYIKRVDDILSNESFRPFRKLRVRARLPEPIEFPKLEARKVDIDTHSKSGFLLL
ncbi:hypothetical protein QCA50_013516 [Cerrena zonata]|uniref:F-box domain-containing protein n=1 Tax=Cerrena zonata TaxID=2478898 RepID=A0AAW0FVZ9_9APHY